MSDEDRPLEDLESFRLRASAWLAQRASIATRAAAFQG